VRHAGLFLIAWVAPLIGLLIYFILRRYALFPCRFWTYGARTSDGELRYTFADPYKCRCLYIGGPKEYAAYQRLVEREQAAEFASGAGSIRWGPGAP
jgi:hypothetical protein